MAKRKMSKRRTTIYKTYA